MQIHGVGIITGCIYVSLGFGLGAALVYMVLMNEVVLGCQDFYVWRESKLVPQITVD
jgi:hypothetical protein